METLEYKMGPIQRSLFCVDFNGSPIRGAEVGRGQAYAMPLINVWIKSTGQMIKEVYATLASVAHGLDFNR